LRFPDIERAVADQGVKPALELVLAGVVPFARQGPARLGPEIVDDVRAANFKRDQMVESLLHPVRSRDAVALVDQVRAFTAAVPEAAGVSRADVVDVGRPDCAGREGRIRPHNRLGRRS
jgi:hypothetical protein